MFRLRVAKMLRRGLKSLDKLDAVKEAKRTAKQVVKPKDPLPDPSPALSPNPNDFLDLSLALALAAYNPSDPF
jgi:hypothetical protein